MNWEYMLVWIADGVCFDFQITGFNPEVYAGRHDNAYLVDLKGKLLLDVLNTLGARRWELVTVAEAALLRESGAFSMPCYHFKRALSGVR